MPLPGSTLAVQIFPTKLKVFDLSVSEEQPIRDIDWVGLGPLEGFTAQLDLEKGRVRVWGEAQTGFFRYRLHALSSGGILLYCEKAPDGVVLEGVEMAPGQKMFLGEEGTVYQPSHESRLSLGVTRKLDWELVSRRCDMAEILPVWLALAAQIPEHSVEGGEVGKVLNGSSPENIVPLFRDLFRVGYRSLLTPTQIDRDHQGYTLPTVTLKEGAKLAYSLFFRSEGSEIKILPLLPPEFHCGRLIGVKVGDWGVIDLEWSKKLVRRLIFRAAKSGEVSFRFQPSIRHCRLQSGLTGYQNGAPLQIEEGKEYAFDRFEK